MVSRNVRGFFSSFWLTFLAVMIVNQILLFAIFHIITIRPSAHDLTQMFGVTLEVAKYIDQHDPENGLIKLQNQFKDYPSIEISKKSYVVSDIPWSLFGLKMLRNSIVNSYSEKIDVGFFVGPDGKKSLIFQTKQAPFISLRVVFNASTLAEQYLKYSFGLVLLISLWAAYWISSRIVEPLNRLSDSALKIATTTTTTTGAEPIDLELFPLPEIKKLASTYNVMRETIDQNIKDREALLSSVTHDIRTPLSRMRLALDLNKDINPSFKDEFLDDIKEMNTIIQQFNELAKLNLEIEEPWKLVDLNELIKTIQLKYQRAHVDLKTNLCPELRKLNVKYLSITRLLYNLIDNAYRHGNSDVTISTYQNHREIMISVSNPLPDASLGYESYEDPIFNHKTGLGLKIINRLADVHNATITQSTLYGVREYRLIFME